MTEDTTDRDAAGDDTLDQHAAPIVTLGVRLHDLALVWAPQARGRRRFPRIEVAPRIVLRDLRDAAGCAVGLELFFESGAGFGYDIATDPAAAAGQLYGALGRRPARALDIARMLERTILQHRV